METKQATYLAYRSIGIKPPEDFNVRPWQEWCSPEAHKAKGEIIHGFILNHARPLQLLEVWRANGCGTILTNASPEAVAAVRARFGLLESADIRSGMKAADKAMWLGAQPRHGIYFDDSKKTIDLVEERTKWHTVWVQ